MAHDPRRRWSMDDVARVLELLASASPVVPTATGAPPPAPVSPLHADGTPATQALTPAPTPRPTPASLPAPDPGSEPAGSQRRRGRVLPILIGVVVVALIGVIAALALMDDPQDTTPPPGAARTPSTTTTSEPSGGSSSPAQEPPTEAELETFVEDYLVTASDDPAAGFSLLTPSYQAASGGIEGYEGFWGRVSNPRVQSISADTGALTVSYVYEYSLRGDGRRTDPVTLQLQRDGDGFLIDGAT